MSMKLVAVSVGLPREVTWHGGVVNTGIYKQPMAGRVAARKLNLDSDRQADLSVHGGEYKAVYCYPIEHYDYWRRELPGKDLPMGRPEHGAYGGQGRRRGEPRWHALGMVGGRFLLIVVHVYREAENGEEIIRIISARKASEYEGRVYFQ
jgi:hypothetical protein